MTPRFREEVPVEENNRWNGCLNLGVDHFAQTCFANISTDIRPCAGPNNWTRQCKNSMFVTKSNLIFDFCYNIEFGVTKSNLALQNQIWRCKIKIGVAKSNWRRKIEFGNIWRCKIKVWRCKIKFGIAKIEFIKLFTRHGPFGLLHSGTPNLYELMQELVPSMPQS